MRFSDPSSFLPLDQAHPGGSDPSARLVDMDTEGIDQAVLFPSIGLYFWALADARAAVPIARAYNDWLASYCAADTTRLFGAAMIPMQDPAAAVAELHRARHELGFVAAFVRPNPCCGRSLSDPAYEPVWDAAEESDMPIAVHEGSSVIVPTLGSDRPFNPLVLHAVSHSFEEMLACAQLIAFGVLERHPPLRVVFLESSGGWVPFWLERLDEQAESFGGFCPELVLEPSEYFARQCWISYEIDERTLPALAPFIGEDAHRVGIGLSRTTTPRSPGRWTRCAGPWPRCHRRSRPRSWGRTRRRSTVCPVDSPRRNRARRRHPRGGSPLRRRPALRQPGRQRALLRRARRGSPTRSPPASVPAVCAPTTSSPSCFPRGPPTPSSTPRRPRSVRHGRGQRPVVAARAAQLPGRGPAPAVVTSKELAPRHRRRRRGRGATTSSRWRSTRVRPPTPCSTTCGARRDRVAKSDRHTNTDASAIADPDRPVAVVFTSGTTGEPKGAVFTWRQLEAIGDIDGGGRWGGGGRGLSSTSFAHLGYMTKMPQALRGGGTTFIMGRWSAGDAVEMVERHRITSLGGSPPKWRSCSATTASSPPTRAACG